MVGFLREIAGSRSGRWIGGTVGFLASVATVAGFALEHCRGPTSPVNVETRSPIQVERRLPEDPPSGVEPVPQQPPQGFLSPVDCTPADQCCTICRKGKACGNSCISQARSCSKGPGCACNAADVCR